MRKLFCLTIGIGSLFGVFASFGMAVDIEDTRMLEQPAVSSSQIAFIYSGDLWVADLDGKNARRLTTDRGVESNPTFSPNGKTIAFSAQYDGNTDVYTIPVTGGAPMRLTWHPASDTVRGFTPDGKSVVFSSARNVYTNRYTQLFTVPLTGGMPTQLPIPYGAQACYSGDGQYVAYTPLADRSVQWKNYRGGTNCRIWLYRCNDHQVVEIPKFEGRVNDVDPNWIGDTVYFRSDRHGEYNLYAYDAKTKAVKQLTNYTDFPVLNVNSGAGRLIYEHAGYLYLFDPVRGTDTRLKIGVATDLGETRPRYVKGNAKLIRNASLSPSAARAVFEFRGEIVTVPAEKGDPRNLTNSCGVHDREPVWSPDGKTIAWMSDEGGEYKLRLRAASGKGETKTIALTGTGYFESLVWSPDSTKLAYIDNSETLYWLDVAGGRVEKVAAVPVYEPRDLCALRAAWSPDSRWIAYALNNNAAYHTVYVYSLETKKSTAVTDGLSDAVEPVFDASGKYLYFLASTDAGPVINWFAQSAEDMRFCRALYLVVLKKGVPSPLARESDEEKATDKAEKVGEKAIAKGEKARDEKAKEEKVEKVEPVVIDFEGIEHRIVALPEAAANYSNLQPGSAGQVFYIDWTKPNEKSVIARKDLVRGGSLKRFDLGKRKCETMLAGVSDYCLTPSGKKALVRLSAEGYSIVDVSATPPAADKGKLKIDAIEVRIDPKAEWPQILHEAWRINRDYFYAPNMHGTDWPAIEKKYRQFLPHLATRSDLYRVMRWMLSELAVGHSYLMPAAPLHEVKSVPGGLLGADYEVANGRYRFKKVYGGLNWTPGLRSPLTAPGVDVKAGEYLLAVRGVELKAPTELYSLFENTAGKSIEITVGPNSDGKASRTVTVEPLGDEVALRNRDWVESNLRRVQEATGGRVAYVYVPDTAAGGHAYFKRYFYPQCDKDALILDERHNGGGQIADYYISHLMRQFMSKWATRYGEDMREPSAAIFGPKVMIVNETAGSGGDMLPWMFRKLKLGTIVGKRTWGGLVGIEDVPVLMDGTAVTAPGEAIWCEEGWVVENEGVPPDVEVEQWPAELIAGRDPQLEKAIKIALEELEKNPPKKLTRPEYPVRVTK